MTAVPPRILVLVEHEPTLDPRVGWVTSMCADLARTDVIAAVPAADGRPLREYDERVYVERADANRNAALLAKAVAVGVGALSRAIGRLEPAGAAAYRAVAASALHRRGRAASIPPRVVVCHDLATLGAGIALKRRFGARLLYDAHEYWPQQNLAAGALEEGLTEALERRLIRAADAVVTVSPPLARHLERTYGVDGVVVAPNAVPFDAGVTPSPPRRAGPARFLLQGRLAPGRGIEELLEAWAGVRHGSAQLVVRAPRDAYHDTLSSRYGGAVVFADPVPEARLVEAATDADVGLIPYGGTNLNHRYASPNKLGQYMHAGLAVVARRGEFVSAVLARYDCGLTYDDPASLTEVLDRLVNDADLRARLKANAHDAARREFNWAVQSRDYRRALEELLA